MGSGEKTNMCRAYVLCAHASVNMSGSDSIRSPLAEQHVLGNNVPCSYSVSAEKEEQKGEETCVASKSPDDQTASSTVDRRKNNCAVPATPPHVTLLSKGLTVLVKEPNKDGDVGRGWQNSDTRKC